MVCGSSASTPSALHSGELPRGAWRSCPDVPVLELRPPPDNCYKSGYMLFTKQNVDIEREGTASSLPVMMRLPPAKAVDNAN